MEIANGFSELIDPDDQLARFEEQAEMGRAGDEEAHPVDHDYVERRCATACRRPAASGSASTGW